ncbi:MAG: tRNA (N(6)-L-threonylcarbamoyladenosine(37)-C(2))-methylthiotransferase MtaB [Clostridia bacterium]|nr:tRNA (N(6)-L-threonylcarbamoyladenosine(37)-C(2))-methylthiotransferase MtaB [Clostridia bacterium]
MKAVVYTLGCKVNDVESGSLIAGLEEMGYEVSRELTPADIVVVNTCAVTAEAERKSRQLVGRASKIAPAGKIIVCGCASQKSAEAFLQKGDNVFLVTGAKEKGKILQAVREGLSEKKIAVAENEGGRYEKMPLPKCLKTRSFVKIQDGCNRFCSYCIIPYLRGRSRSRDLDDVVDEVKKGNAEETVLTGIDVSAYRDEKGRDFCDLLHALQDVDTRIRIGSMEVSLITDEFLATAKRMKNFAPHFHLSLQSGSDRVLKSMNRHYTRAEYLSACKKIYSTFENASITTDIIVGFPTETEEDFLDSLRIVEEVGFAQIHAFPYSPREGTNAYKKYKELPAAVKKERVERILAVGKVQKEKYLTAFLEKSLTIIPEQFIDGFTEGYSENYIRLYLPEKVGKVPIKVRAVTLFKDGLQVEKV